MKLRDLDNDTQTRLVQYSDKEFVERTRSTGEWTQFGKTLPMTPEQIWKIAFSCGVKALLEEMTELK